MKMRSVLTIVLTASLLVGGVAISAAKPGVKQVKSKITLSFDSGDEYTQDVFSGRVKASKSCKKKRTVTVSGVAGSTTTRSNGDYSLAAAGVPAGTYTATVAERKRKTNNGTKIVCLAATSDPVTVP